MAEFSRRAETAEAYMKRLGFEVWDTGGGGTAWCKRMGDDTHLIVTARGGMRHAGDPDAAIWGCGRYMSDGDGSVDLKRDDHTLEQAVAAAHELPSPVMSDGTYLQDAFDGVAAAAERAAKGGGHRIEATASP